MKQRDTIHWETQILLWIIIMILCTICHKLNAQNLDIHLLRQINTPHELVTDGFFRGVSNSTFFISVGTPLTMMITGEIRNDPKLLKTSCILIVSTATTFAITDILKHAVNRQRPFVTYKDILNKSRVVTLDPSFPSGHTSSAFNTATFISLHYPKWYIILPSFTWAGTVAYSRMYLGVHYPSDVLVGALIGSGTAYLTHVLNKKLYNR
jgi:membrane-associated phospholipid phosphatase